MDNEFNNEEQTNGLADDPFWESIFRKENTVGPVPESVENLNVFTNPQQLKKYGFNQVISDRECPDEKMQNILAETRKRINQVIEAWENIYKNARQRYQDKIAKAEEDIRVLLIDSKKAESIELEELLQGRQDLVRELDSIKAAIFDLRNALAFAKEGMGNKLMTEAKELIDNALQLHKNAFDEIKGINETKFEQEKIALQMEVKELTEIRDAYKEYYSEIKDKIKIISGEGINPFLSYILIGIGTATAGTAGYFFSVFSYTTSFSNQDVFYFLLSSFINSSKDSELSFLQKIGFLVSVLIAVTLISACCYYLIRKLIKGKKAVSTNFRIRSNVRYQGISYFNNIPTTNWFALWLHILPIIFIAGISIIIISLNRMADRDINMLNASTEGLVIGTAMAMAFSAVLYLYIIKVIEPRTKLGNNENTSSSWFKNNWELTGSIILFLTSIVSFIFCKVDKLPLVKGVDLTDRSSIFISLSAFLACCLLTAFAFAYGVRFRSLIATKQFMEKEIFRLTADIGAASVPDLPELEIDYASKLQSLIDGILSTIENKGDALNGAFSQVKTKIPINGTDNLPKGSFFHRVRNWFKADTTDSTDTAFQISERDAYLFPEYDERLKTLKAQYLEKKIPLAEIDDKITQIKNDSYIRILDAEKGIEKLYSNIDRWRGFIIKTEIEKINRLMRFRVQEIEESTALLEGFHLGLWYRENSLGPVKDYYMVGKQQKLIGYGS